MTINTLNPTEAAGSGLPMLVSNGPPDPGELLKAKDAAESAGWRLVTVHYGHQSAYFVKPSSAPQRKLWKSGRIKRIMALTGCTKEWAIIYTSRGRHVHDSLHDSVIKAVYDIVVLGRDMHDTERYTSVHLMSERMRG